MRKMKAMTMGFNDMGATFPPKEFQIKIKKGEFGWSIEGGFKGAGAQIMGTAPTIWGVIDLVTEYLNEELHSWSSFDANKNGENNE